MRALLAGLFTMLLASSAMAAQVSSVNPALCSSPQACVDINSVVIPAINGTTCSASGATPQTCNGTRGFVTTNSLATAATTNAAYVINDSSVNAGSLIQCENLGYSGTIVTNGIPVFISCVPGAGTITVNITNAGANALSGTILIGFSLQ